MPLDPAIAEMLFDWRVSSEYNRPEDFVFASKKKKGEKPYTTRSLLEKNLQPAARAAGISEPVGWHTFRRTVAMLLVNHGEDVKVLQELLRHANIKTTLDVYAEAVTPAKRGAHSRLERALVPERRVV